MWFCMGELGGVGSVVLLRIEGLWGHVLIRYCNTTLGLIPIDAACVSRRRGGEAAIWCWGADGVER